MDRHDPEEGKQEGMGTGQRSHLLTPVIEETARQTGDVSGLLEDRLSPLKEKDRDTLWSRLG
jgi:hypothetical protein